jgi:flagellar P-ring protein precursor FlgI
MTRFLRTIVPLLSLVVVSCACRGAIADTTVKEITRIKGQGESVIQGLGLVMGLPGTGDSGKELTLARPLAQVLANNYNAPEALRELAGIKTVALVMVTCRTPAVAARADDRLDVTVTTLGTAQSLKGGVLYLTPLTEPRPGGKPYAVAYGKIEIEDGESPTTGKVSGGAQIIRDLPSMPIEAGFDLIIDTQAAGWSTAKLLAAVINENAQPQGPAVAFAIDERTVRVDIPEHERSAKAAFLDRALSAPVPTSLLDLPAQVICNERTGVIVVTGDVEISPGIISHKDLVITTTVPPPQPSVINPLVERSRYTALDTQNRPKERARLSDLLAAFKQLDVAPKQQIEVLQLLHKTGRLHARFVMD